MLKQTTMVKDPTRASDPEEEENLKADERWLLVQRVLLSSGFRRARQLRKILLYITRSAILHPDEPLHEYEIACEVLGRRPEFDPMNDNIVRAQMGNLRRKLESFYLEEGCAEKLCVVIPKGSYLPAFTPVESLPLPPIKPEAEPIETPLAEPFHPSTVDEPRRSSWGVLLILLAAGCLLFAAATGVLTWKLTQSNASRISVLSGNSFVKFLSRSSGSVSVILPDTSLSMMQENFHTDVSVAEYSSNQYLQQELGTVSDGQFSQFMSQIRKKRNTSMDEAVAASEFQHILTLSGVPTTLRFARDLRNRDLNEGNSILIGSHTSNPWASLFTQRMNFVFVRDPISHTNYFENLHPQPGEQARYLPYQQQDGKVSSYIDVALTINLTSSGYVLVFNGSDSQSVEAASHFLLYGKLPPVIDSMLRRDDLNYFEIFLRGAHAAFQSDETLEVVGVRSSSGK